MRKNILHTALILVAGLSLGALSKLLDLYTTNLGNIFSELSIWILFGTILSIFSRSPKRAAVNVFVFCVGMLFAYYLTAVLTGGGYSKTFVTGWCLFTLFCPVFAWATWYTKEKGLFGRIVALGILFVAPISSVLLFDGPRVYDFIIEALLLYFLFFQKGRRP